jgi:hypothetical protein
MRAVLAILVVCGCGGSSHTAPPPPPQPHAGSGAPATPTTAHTPAIDVAAVCNRIVDLATQHCGKFAEIGVDAKQCVSELGPATADPAFKMFAECVLNPSCEEVTNCLAAADQAAANDGSDANQKLRACKDRPDAGDAVGIPKAEWDKRNGANLSKFSQAVSTKALPIEMCGIPAENRWLGTLACDDGSRPITSSVDAENLRAGNVGEGGRCGSILDLYKVACPEKTYDIYIDAYICPLEK